MNRMNASDIVKNKQNQALYKAYYQPTVFQSTTFSTIRPISSFTTGSATYASTVNTVYNYTCQPTFVTYEMRDQVKNGKGVCDGFASTDLKWSNVTSTTVYAYKTLYSTLSTPSSIAVTSTVVQGSKGPVICSLIDFHQGTSFANQCGDDVPISRSC